jgi:hypothetical protein
VNWPFHHSCSFLSVQVNTFMRYNMTQILHLTPKLHLKYLHIIVSTPIVLRPCQHVVHALPRICCILVYHQNMLTKCFEQGFENKIHQSFKCGRFVRKAKQHHQKLKMTFMCSKCCFGDVFLPHSNLMISIMEIQLGKENFSLHFI